MLPVIAIVGRPNVGKSTLFNALTRSRDALVANMPGLTRDRKFGRGKVGPFPYILIDTGGLVDEQPEDPISALISHQVLQAVRQADRVLLMMDGREGLTALDEYISQRLRSLNIPVTLVINKSENAEPNLISADFQTLGFSHWGAISASHRQGLEALMEDVLSHFPYPSNEFLDEDKASGIRVAVVGRPNVGKSTLVNRILGEERQLTYDQPGTTRDSIAIPFERGGEKYVLVDTAGVRRRAKVRQSVEKFSVIKALEAIEQADVVLMLFDASEGVTEQDANLLGLILESGRALILVVNKWDGLTPYQRRRIQDNITFKLHFIDFAKLHFISALHGVGVGDLFKTIQQAWESSHCEVSTTYLNKILQDAVSAHPPPLVRGRRIKLRYVHQGGQNPPTFIIHGNQTNETPESYQRYLANVFRRVLHLEGVPLRIEFKRSDNPYRDRKNPLTLRQVRKRQRLIRHVKKR